MTARPKIVAVAGNIGAGKSSLVGWLEQQLGMVPFYEPHAENPYLADFYQDMLRWGLHSQLFFLIHRFRIHKDIEERARHEGRHIVQDRTIYEDAEIFAAQLHRSGALADRDWAMYCDLYGTLRKELRPPDLMIYLRCSVRAIRRRITRRGRPSELAIPTVYLQGLNRLYEEWMDGYDLSPKVVWDSERADYLTHIVDRLEFRKMIEPFL